MKIMTTTTLTPEQLEANRLHEEIHAEAQNKCDRPPLGWECTRGYHFDGPCAAIPIDLYGGDRLYEFCDKYRHGTISVSGMRGELASLIKTEVTNWIRIGSDSSVVSNDVLDRISAKVCSVLADEIDRRLKL